MKMLKSRKGFTLIELLIVITIIGILAVAFLPTLLGAPAKGRDTQRIADLQKIQKILVNADLEGTTLPAADTCINGTSFSAFLSSFGGAVPTDPQATNALPTDGTITCTGEYYYKVDPNTDYTFGLYSNLENEDGANSTCVYTGALVTPTTATDHCYIINNV